MPKLVLPLLSRQRIRQIADMAIGLQNSRGSRVADQAIYDAVGVADLATETVTTFPLRRPDPV